MGSKNNIIIIAVVVAVLVIIGALWFFNGTLFQAPLVEEVEKGPLVAVAESEMLDLYVVDGVGMTLYTTTREGCTDACLTLWPPYIALGDVELEEPLGVIVRDDIEGEQYTWKGELLYYYAGDEAPGDTNGHEVGGVWFVARP